MILYVIYGGIALLGIAAVVFSITGIVYLNSVSTKITYLEQEIDKRSQEFAALRKDKQEILDGPSRKVIISGEDSLISHHPDSSSHSEEIQVFRNVRGKFEVSRADNSPAQETVQPATPMHQTPATESNVAPQEATLPKPPVAPVAPVAESKTPVALVIESKPPVAPAQQPVAAQAKKDEEPGAIFAKQADEASSDVMDVVNETAGDAAAADMGSPIEIYSDEKKDADFEQASILIKQRLATGPDITITLDFKNILFLYKEELAYIGKIEEYLRSNSGKVFLINCEGEIRDILLAHPQLGKCIREI